MYDAVCILLPSRLYCWSRSFTGSAAAIKQMQVADSTASGELHPAPKLFNIAHTIAQSYKAVKVCINVLIKLLCEPGFPSEV